jgi:pimeloyl-ACP methyl ester carboxylesterase
MAEAEIEINGGIVVYEFVGPDDGEVVVLTPGGRFSKDYGGVHELAYALADGGQRVLLWDRPNCGRSDIQLYGKSESHMRAETMGTLLKTLGIDQVVSAGGSGGARDSIVFTLMYPELVTKLAVWHIVRRRLQPAVPAGPTERAADGPVPGHRRRHQDGRPAGSWSDLVAVKPWNEPGCGDRRRVRAGHDPLMEAFVPKLTERSPGSRTRRSVDQRADPDRPGRRG